jgi:hypothetical protein
VQVAFDFSAVRRQVKVGFDACDRSYAGFWVTDQLGGVL